MTNDRVDVPRAHLTAMVHDALMHKPDVYA